MFLGSRLLLLVGGTFIVYLYISDVVASINEGHHFHVLLFGFAHIAELHNFFPPRGHSLFAQFPIPELYRIVDSVLLVSVVTTFNQHHISQEFQVSHLGLASAT